MFFVYVVIELIPQIKLWNIGSLHLLSFLTSVVHKLQITNYIDQIIGISHETQVILIVIISYLYELKKKLSKNVKVLIQPHL